MGRLISASISTLRSIVIRPSTPPEAFPAIYDLPLLQSLELGEPQFSDQVPSEILSPLEDVRLICSCGPNLTQFLRRLSTKKLAALLIISGETIQPPTSIARLINWATATLGCLNLSLVTTFGCSSIALLCTFTNLTSITISCVCVDHNIGLPLSFQPTDQDLLNLGGALPRIHSLDLSTGCRMLCQVTFKSLIGLSRICGNLERPGKHTCLPGSLPYRAS